MVAPAAEAVGGKDPSGHGETDPHRPGLGEAPAAGLPVVPRHPAPGQGLWRWTPGSRLLTGADSEVCIHIYNMLISYLEGANFPESTVL